MHSGALGEALSAAVELLARVAWRTMDERQGASEAVDGERLGGERGMDEGKGESGGEEMGWDGRRRGGGEKEGGDVHRRGAVAAMAKRSPGYFLKNNNYYYY